MRHYENLVIVKPTLTEEEIHATIAKIEEVITSNGGEIVARDAMGMRKLAYPIEKNVRGYFHVMYYTIDPSAILEIERRFRINEEMLRYVTIKYDSKREVAAWQEMVKKALTKPAPSAPAPEEAAAEEKPATEEKPAAEEKPATEEAAAATETAETAAPESTETTES